MTIPAAQARIDAERGAVSLAVEVSALRGLLDYCRTSGFDVQRYEDANENPVRVKLYIPPHLHAVARTMQP